jgi:hypothetical protein
MEFTIPNEARVGENWVVLARTTVAPVLTSTSEAFIVNSSQASLTNWGTSLKGELSGWIRDFVSR